MAWESIEEFTNAAVKGPRCGMVPCVKEKGLRDTDHHERMQRVRQSQLRQGEEALWCFLQALTKAARQDGPKAIVISPTSGHPQRRPRPRRCCLSSQSTHPFLCPNRQLRGRGLCQLRANLNMWIHFVNNRAAPKWAILGITFVHVHVKIVFGGRLLRATFTVVLLACATFACVSRRGHGHLRHSPQTVVRT
jgi:hypothetical protein